MSVPSPSRAGRGRGPVVVLLGACAVTVVITTLACIVLAAFGFFALRVAATARSTEEHIVPVETESQPVGDAIRGNRVFAGEGGCSACHSLEAGVRTVGPSLAGVASRAALRLPNIPAEVYLYESIVNPNAYVVEGFHGNIMPAGYGNRLDEQQLSDLVAFLMTK